MLASVPVIKEQVLDGRNSYSKTDTDATFMRMKKDRIGNGQLKPGYNLQVSTNNQYIVNYSIHHDPTDTTTMPAHIDGHKVLYKETPGVVVADAGYGSEQNYGYLEANGIGAYVKHGYFDRDQKAEAGKGRKDATGDKRPFTPEKPYCDAARDRYICPMGQSMDKIWEGEQQSDAGHKRTISQYRGPPLWSLPVAGRMPQVEDGPDDRSIARGEAVKAGSCGTVAERKRDRLPQEAMLGCGTGVHQPEAEQGLPPVHAPEQGKGTHRNRIVGPGAQPEEKNGHKRPFFCTLGLPASKGTHDAFG